MLTMCPPVGCDTRGAALVRAAQPCCARTSPLARTFTPACRPGMHSDGVKLPGLSSSDYPGTTMPPLDVPQPLRSRSRRSSSACLPGGAEAAEHAGVGQTDALGSRVHRPALGQRLVGLFHPKQ